MEDKLRLLNLNDNVPSPIRLRNRIVPRNDLKSKSKTSKHKKSSAPETNTSSQPVTSSSLVESFNEPVVSSSQVESFSEPVASSSLLTSFDITSKTLSSALVDYSDTESTYTLKSGNSNEDDIDDIEYLNNYEFNEYCIQDEFSMADDEFYNQDDLIEDEKLEQKSIEPVFISTKNEKPKMIFGDFEYLYEKDYNETIYWRCAVTNPQCKARIHTDFSYNIVKIANDYHYHEDDEYENKDDKITKSKVSTELKERAKTTLEKPRTIIKDVLYNVPVSSASAIPPIHNLKQQVDRKRKKVYDFGAEAKTKNELVIKDKYKSTKSGKEFILCDTGSNDPERIVVLSTLDSLALLNTESVWYIDGTFNVSPDIFKQNNRNLALVYSFLPNKQEATYTRLFNILKSHGVKIVPDHVLCDYELAVINSVKNCFPGVNIGGCYFHLCANIWKHVSNGLRTVYNKDIEFKKYYKYLKLMPFVPQKDLIGVFSELQTNCPMSIKPIYKYFETYYIGLPKSPGSKLRSKPSFPIITWHVLKRVSENLPRSNNSIEAWHKALSQDIHSHPETNRLINHLLKEQHLMEICWEQIKCGVVFPRDPREVKKDVAINSLSKTFNMTNYLDYFNKLIKLLK